MWKLYGGMKPHSVHPLKAAPAWRLNALLDALLPGWYQTLGRRWSALELIQMSGHIVDAAFLNVVHMYKHMLGSRFPSGVFEWPPDKWLKTYRERKVAAAACDSRLPRTTRVANQAKSGCQPREGASECRVANQVKSGCQPERGTDCAKARRETAETGRVPRATHESGCQPSELGSPTKRRRSSVTGCRPSEVGLSTKRRRISEKASQPSDVLSLSSKWAADAAL